MIKGYKVNFCHKTPFAHTRILSPYSGTLPSSLMKQCLTKCTLTVEDCAFGIPVTESASVATKKPAACEGVIPESMMHVGQNYRYITRTTIAYLPPPPLTTASVTSCKKFKAAVSCKLLELFCTTLSMCHINLKKDFPPTKARTRCDNSFNKSQCCFIVVS